MPSHQQYANLQGGAEVFSPIILYSNSFNREQVQLITERGLISTVFVIEEVWF